MREVVIDTETTGLDPATGHRVVEIGCVELINHVATGRTWQSYLNPERDMPVEAALVHGLKDEFLVKQPLFAEVAAAFLEFIGDAPLIAHNAGFDMGFINAELTRHGFAALPKERATDTVALARRMFPGAPASLDALCKRFGVDASEPADAWRACWMRGCWPMFISSCAAAASRILRLPRSPQGWRRRKR